MDLFYVETGHPNGFVTERIWVLATSVAEAAEYVERKFGGVMTIKKEGGRVIVLPESPKADGHESLEFLKRAADGKHRVVSSGDLIPIQISEAQSEKKFYVDPETGLGWALIPWDLTTMKDRMREERYFKSDSFSGSNLTEKQEEWMSARYSEEELKTLKGMLKVLDAMPSSRSPYEQEDGTFLAKD